MKLWDFLSPIFKGIIGVAAFLISIGWAAFLSVNAIVKAEGREIREEFHNFRDQDMQQINARFDETQALIRVMIKEKK